MNYIQTNLLHHIFKYKNFIIFNQFNKICNLNVLQTLIASHLNSAKFLKNLVLLILLLLTPNNSNFFEIL